MLQELSEQDARRKAAEKRSRIIGELRAMGFSRSEAEHEADLIEAQES